MCAVTAVVDKSEGDADAMSLAKLLHTVHIAKGNPSTDDAKRKL